MRARLALQRAAVEVEHREVLLKNKPSQMLEASDKGTVPVLVLTDGTVIDESLDVAIWALDQGGEQKPEQHGLLWTIETQDAQLELIQKNDHDFKYWLDRYKYHVGYPEHPPEHYRAQAEKFLITLEEFLTVNSFLFGNSESLADIAIFPFIRQFAFVDKGWFDQTETQYPNLHQWFNHWLQSDEFESIMIKHPEWLPIQN